MAERTVKTVNYNFKERDWKPTETKVNTPDAPSTSNVMSKDEIQSNADDILKKGKSKSSKSKSSKKANQKAKAIISLEGELVLRMNTKTVRIRIGDTVKLEGLGPYLSGLYYVTTVSKTLDGSGYNQTLSVMKMNTGKTLKEVSTNVIGPKIIQRS